MTDCRPPPDRGQGIERTRLAWRRTLLAATTVTVLCIRLAVDRAHPPAGAIVTAAALLTWLGGPLLGWYRDRAIRSGQLCRLLPLYAGVPLAYALLGLILVVLPRD